MLLTGGLWFNLCNSLFYLPPHDTYVHVCALNKAEVVGLWNSTTLLEQHLGSWAQYLLFRHNLIFSDKTEPI